MSFPAYPSYRDSEVEWLGPVPSHWSPTRLRFLAHLNPSKSEVSDLSSDTEVSFVPMDAIGERGELSLEQTRALSDVLTGYTYFREGDVSIAKITPCFENGKGAIMRGLSAGVGFGTTELIITRPRPDATTPEFLDWLFRSPAFRTPGQAAMYGAGGQKRVPDDFVRDFFSPGAPLAEQVTISAFLDGETAKIDALIEEQRRLIALLKEKRQAVISHAVTKGLDPHAPMKDSGIEWLGEVPAHWKVRRIKAILKCIAQGWSPQCDSEPVDSPEQWGVLKVGCVNGGLFNPAENKALPLDLMPSPDLALRAGDVLVSRANTRELVGSVALIERDYDRLLLCDKLYRLDADRSQVEPGFLAIYLRSDAARGQIEVAASGASSSMQNIGQSVIREMPIAVPPMVEQREILERLTAHNLTCASLSGQAGKAISLLKERRAALISAAVTGKIDVRGLAKVLPFPIDRARARALIATEIIERSAHQATFGRVKFQKIAFLAEAHVGVNELAGSYTREAAGPLDRMLIDEMENGARSIAGIEHEQPGGAGTTVSYRLGQQRGTHRHSLTEWLGADRTAKLDKLITDFAVLTTKQAEAVATLYGVWNDALSEGASPADDEIISEFLNDWHPEKRKKFRASELSEWLGWMRRNGIVPSGSGPKTMTGRLFV